MAEVTVAAITSPCNKLHYKYYSNIINNIKPESFFKWVIAKNKLSKNDGLKLVKLHREKMQLYKKLENEYRGDPLTCIKATHSSTFKPNSPKKVTHNMVKVWYEGGIFNFQFTHNVGNIIPFAASPFINKFGSLKSSGILLHNSNDIKIYHSVDVGVVYNNFFEAMYSSSVYNRYVDHNLSYTMLGKTLKNIYDIELYNKLYHNMPIPHSAKILRQKKFTIEKKLIFDLKDIGIYEHNIIPTMLIFDPTFLVSFNISEPFLKESENIFLFDS